SVFDAKRSTDEEELPATETPTRLVELSEVQVVEQVDPHRVECQCMDGEVDPLRGARRSVVVAVGPERRHPPLVQEERAARIKASLRAGRVPRPELVEAFGVTDSDEEDVPLADHDALSTLGLLQVGGAGGIAGLQPPHPPGEVDVGESARATPPRC